MRFVNIELVLIFYPLIFHVNDSGVRDLICPIAHVRDFVDSFRKIPGASMTFIELPGANHFAHAVSSPRAHYIAYGKWGAYAMTD